MVRVDPHHGVLARVEIRTALEDLGRDLMLFGRPPLERARREEVEQLRIRARAAERPAAHDLLGLIADEFLLGGL
jgi:hypothetical protein